MAVEVISRKRFAPYRFILGPEQLSASAGRPVSTPEDYLGWHTTIVTSRGGTPWDSPEPTRARVNHGRWLADCFWCKGGILTRPEWGVAYCGECGARYRKGQVVFPTNHAAISRALSRRVRRDQQNWDDRQTVEDLEAENRKQEVITP